mmetsp:Transcript_28950/g.53447  ORF Transcript_28950/g.53447 Transcript_28950/m.53447 type:complete len:159 (+) Transcript_28950:109-585(+)|eukprot:CAMPEP_0202019768 /NCGR_PEP_ID=MMETSP0905-20130828/42835_1 /ASSEMBLY_ACC=CAM_ASM_000554 /TAXON_ID=420261 /ORGANISM="Thalassiosira antarctica, Strain CCMP982" /LENGTH=158 /DNA_ID=CAMNT_0048581145 /DNA_START=88 /DNA_END=564 /DNA_ORIENTATION=-
MELRSLSLVKTHEGESGSISGKEEASKAPMRGVSRKIISRARMNLVAKTPMFVAEIARISQHGAEDDVASPPLPAIPKRKADAKALRIASNSASVRILLFETSLPAAGSTSFNALIVRVLPLPLLCYDGSTAEQSRVRRSFNNNNTTTDGCCTATMDE